MKYIYRVEDMDGIGCYAGYCDSHFLGKHTLYNGHPRPEDDEKILREIAEDERCGFLNLTQAMRWFTSNELRQLEKEAFYLKRVKVKEITAIGNSQVLAII